MNALASKIVEGNSGEWALFRRHKSEDMFGIQIAGAFADNVAKCGELAAANTWETAANTWPPPIGSVSRRTARTPPLPPAPRWA